uniref:Uncharacterized protein n=1 Tax=Musa acuminata subsp. malaccensis TaxID=214687 RepID=A0A804J6I4_MUSAM
MMLLVEVYFHRLIWFTIILKNYYQRCIRYN